MKKTGDDELDFLREGSSWVLNRQAKMYFKYALPFGIAVIAILSGVIALLSTTVAVWVGSILGTLLLIQALLVTAGQLLARHQVKKYTSSTEALDKALGSFFE